MTEDTGDTRDTKIIRLVDRQPHGLHDNSMVIAACERMLERAKNGELIGVAFIGLTSDGCVATGWSLGDDPSASLFALMGGASHLAHRINAGIDS